jgi:tripartite-type tricarboxylate transporter receptor subunit TctC
MKKAMAILLVCILGTALVFVGGQRVAEGKAKSAEEFYQNNIVDLYLGSKPGGGSDFAARIFAAYWQDVVGGKSAMRVICNPQAGGIVSVNQVYYAKPDGLIMGAGPLGTRIVTPTLLKAPGVKFDAAKFIYIGQYALDPYSFAISAKLPYKSMEELKAAKGLKFGGQAKDSPASLGNALVAYVYGLDAKIISGYGGSSEIALACGKGELNGMMVSAGSMRDYANKGWVKPPFLSLAFKRSVVYPDMPTIAQAMKLTNEQTKAYELFNLMAPEAKCIFATPGIPEDRVKFIRETFNKIMKLKGFQKQIKNRWGAFEEPVPGGETQKQIGQLMKTPKSDIDWFNNALSPYIK